MNEIDRANQFLASALEGDTALMALVTGVHFGVAPQGVTWPLVTFAFLSGNDVHATDVRAMTRLRYAVFGIALDSMTLAAQIADRIEAVLEGASGPAGSDGYVAGISRDFPLLFTETIEGGSLAYRMGGQYRIDIHRRAA